MQSLRTVVPEPAISRRGLMVGGGVAWGIGGMILLWRAFHVGVELPQSQIWVWGLGVLIGWLKYQFVFRGVALRNIARIRQLAPHKDKVCLFAFQPMQAYLIILVMVPLGIALRHTGLPPAVLLAVYVAIGLGLVFGGGEYLRAAGRFR